ncbi:MAG: MgtC/SapB family protein [Verrucomicrobiota bacterium]|jgi:putative Mg2+ transporter-C (MgtC) family protein
MNTVEFLLRLGCALLCGVVIGAERQWRQRTAGLRTYTLVAVGSAMFVIVGCLIPDTSSTRMASYVVSGVGFLGAGVIMRSGLNIRGINTAATIWCSSALGTLSGFGYFKFACVGAACVLGVNTLLRPVVALINRQPVDLSEQEFKYALYLTCVGRQEAQLRTLLVQLTTVSPLVLHELESVVGKSRNHAVLKAILSSQERMDAQVEQLVSRLSLEKDVVGMNWQLLPQAKTD